MNVLPFRSHQGQLKYSFICYYTMNKNKPSRTVLVVLVEQKFKKATYIKAYAFLKMISEGKFSFSLLF